MTRFPHSYWSNLKLDHVTKSSIISKCQNNRPNTFIKIKNTNNMSSRHSTLLENDTIVSQASTTASGLTMSNAFSRLMAAALVVQSTTKRDLYTRPIPVYNQYYNPFQVLVDDLYSDYSPYVYGEPLYDDRAIVVARLLKHYTAAGAAKKLRTQWVQKVGYALTDNSKPDKPIKQACKHYMSWFFKIIIVTNLGRLPQYCLL